MRNGGTPKPHLVPYHSKREGKRTGRVHSKKHFDDFYQAGNSCTLYYDGNNVFEIQAQPVTK